MFLCLHLFGISYSKRYVYIPQKIIRLPSRILCNYCKAMSIPTFIVDTYNMDFCTEQLILYTSSPYLACYKCKNKILFHDIVCDKCIIKTKHLKYCTGCGALKRFYNWTKVQEPF